MPLGAVAAEREPEAIRVTIMVGRGHRRSRYSRLWVLLPAARGWNCGCWVRWKRQWGVGWSIWAVQAACPAWVGRPVFSGQLTNCYIMLRTAGSGTHRRPLAGSGIRAPSGDVEYC